VKEIAVTGPKTAPVVEAGRNILRETHRLTQTPHAFGANWLRQAHASASEAVEDSEMISALGARVIMVDGEPTNIQVTTPEELALANLLAPAVFGARG
jgi:2-C-methyl-D-erythritol 4-phosphate cytidylyltransferase